MRDIRRASFDRDKVALLQQFLRAGADVHVPSQPCIRAADDIVENGLPLLARKGIQILHPDRLLIGGGTRHAETAMLPATRQRQAQTRRKRRRQSIRPPFFFDQDAQPLQNRQRAVSRLQTRRVRLHPGIQVGGGESGGHVEHRHDDGFGEVGEHAAEDGEGGGGLLVEFAEGRAGELLEVVERSLRRRGGHVEGWRRPERLGM